MATATAEKLKLAVKLSQVWLLPVIVPIVSNLVVLPLGQWLL